MKKIVVLSTFAYSLLNLRGDMMREMIELGHHVMAAAPESEMQWDGEFRKRGLQYVAMPLERTGLNPAKDIRTLIFLYRLFKKEKPDIIFAYQAKAVVYGCLAAKMAGVPDIYALIAGLGSIFQLQGFKGSLIRVILEHQYRAALSCCRKVFFQNQDDTNEFVTLGLVKAEKAVLIHGSGVNMKHFAPQAMPLEPVYLFVGRLLRDKGLLEYMQAARLVKKNYPQARFQVLGPLETNPMAVKAEELKPFSSDGSVEFFGMAEDVRPFLKACYVFVLPSYREGTSRAALEALAVGRPIITTDVPGCRETVIDGVNGWLVKAKNPEMLAEKMIWMIEHPDEARRMGLESLRICAERYDVNEVNRVILRTLELLPN